jgi:hypothetical protein
MTGPGRNLMRYYFILVAGVLVLVVVLPMAPLEPLGKCLFLVVLSTDIFHITIFTSPSGVRNQSGCIVFVAILEAVHCFHILHMGR